MKMFAGPGEMLVCPVCGRQQKHRKDFDGNCFMQAIVVEASSIVTNKNGRVIDCQVVAKQG